MDIYELADMLAEEIEESGKTRWSAKDVKEFFLSEGINLSLDEILQVWDACSSPICACELLGCEAIMGSNNYTSGGLAADLEDAVDALLENFMKKWGDYIADSDELSDMISKFVENWIISSDYFEGFLVEHNLSLFKNKSELIIANRFSEDLSDCREKVYTRDILINA